MLALRIGGELTTPEVRGAGVVERGAGGWAATAHVPGLLPSTATSCAHLGEDDYVGMDVHRSAGRGGWISSSRAGGQLAVCICLFGGSG
jgi:hypothetical protein